MRNVPIGIPRAYDAFGNLRGDLNHDGNVDLADIDLLLWAINQGVEDELFDLNGDGVVDNLTGGDLDQLILYIVKTYYGDANLDGQFNSADMTVVFGAGEYEDGNNNNSGWAEGDWTGDGDFDSADYLLAMLYGTYENGPNPQFSNPAVEFIFGYTGRLYDRETKLQNNLHRWYDPQVGRWLSQDPIGFAAGDANLYRYVGNAPTRMADPTGLDWDPRTWYGKYNRWVEEGAAKGSLNQLKEREQNRKMRSDAAAARQTRDRVTRPGGEGGSAVCDAVEPIIGAAKAVAELYPGAEVGIAAFEEGDGRDFVTGRELSDTEIYDRKQDAVNNFAKDTIVGAAAAGVGVLGRKAAKGRLNQLVHLTDDAGQFGIAKTGTVIGSHGIFAVPAHVAQESTALKVLRTGLTPGKTKNAVPICDEALELFKRPIPVGPYSGWKFFGGVRYAPAGSLSTATGKLAQSASLIGPKVLIYGPDGVFYVGIATAGGLYIYGQTGGGE